RDRGAGRRTGRHRGGGRPRPRVAALHRLRRGDLPRRGGAGSLAGRPHHPRPLSPRLRGRSGGGGARAPLRPGGARAARGDQPAEGHGRPPRRRAREAALRLRGDGGAGAAPPRPRRDRLPGPRRRPGGSGDRAAPVLPGAAGGHVAGPAGAPDRRGRSHPGREPVSAPPRIPSRRGMPARLLAGVATLAVALLCAIPLAAQEAGPALRGDVNQDGRITAVDALAVLSGVVGKTLPDGYRLLPHGDADGNGLLSSLDALLILAHSVGKDVSGYPVGTPLPHLRIRTPAPRLSLGERVRLQAEVAGLADTAVLWRSADPVAVAVSADGEVTARVPDVSIRVTALARADTTVRDSVIVQVEAREPSPGRISPSRAMMAIGDRLPLALLDASAG